MRERSRCGVVREPLGRERNEKRNKGRERVRKEENRKII